MSTPRDRIMNRLSQMREKASAAAASPPRSEGAAGGGGAGLSTPLKSSSSHSAISGLGGGWGGVVHSSHSTPGLGGGGWGAVLSPSPPPAVEERASEDPHHLKQTMMASTIPIEASARKAKSTPIRAPSSSPPPLAEGGADFPTLPGSPVGMSASPTGVRGKWGEAASGVVLSADDEAVKRLNDQVRKRQSEQNALRAVQKRLSDEKAAIRRYLADLEEDYGQDEKMDSLTVDKAMLMMRKLLWTGLKLLGNAPLNSKKQQEFYNLCVEEALLEERVSDQRDSKVFIEWLETPGATVDDLDITIPEYLSCRRREEEEEEAS